MKSLNYLRNIKSQNSKNWFYAANSNIPLLFCCFCHNLTVENLESKIKMVNFNSRMYKFDDNKK